MVDSIDSNQLSKKWSRTMSGKAEEMKGRVKEAAGAMTANEKLRREGKIDQAAGKVKQAAEKVVDKSKEALEGHRS
jgi:uncharacterized protein YjbJ (UPF0337 family)